MRAPEKGPVSSQPTSSLGAHFFHLWNGGSSSCWRRDGWEKWGRFLPQVAVGPGFCFSHICTFWRVASLSLLPSKVGLLWICKGRGVSPQQCACCPWPVGPPRPPPSRTVPRRCRSWWSSALRPGAPQPRCRGPRGRRDSPGSRPGGRGCGHAMAPPPGWTTPPPAALTPW
jgi:hypothetical protein